VNPGQMTRLLKIGIFCPGFRCGSALLLSRMTSRYVLRDHPPSLAAGQLVLTQARIRKQFAIINWLRQASTIRGVLWADVGCLRPSACCPICLSVLPRSTRHARRLARCRDC
jgi:hypothetical protein